MARTRGQRAGLDTDAVLREALWLLEHEGLAAVSMRRVAERLGVTPNALYSHVPDHASMIDGLLDLVLADVEVPRRGDWQGRLERLILRTWEALVAQPELVPHYFSRRTLGPHALRIGDATLALLREGGVEGRDATWAMRALMVYAIGSAAVGLPPSDAAAATTAREQSRATFRAGLHWFVAGLVAEHSPR
jgi:TetR/AcrR family transcriptional regulator, tetracycline repressor protein